METHTLSLFLLSVNLCVVKSGGKQLAFWGVLGYNQDTIEEAK